MAEVTLGELIRRRRRELKVTQMELAKQIGVKHTYISKIETGIQRGSYEKLAKIALVLKIYWVDMMKTGEIKIPQLYQDDSLYPILDDQFTRFHPRVKAQLIDIGKIIEKYL